MGKKKNKSFYKRQLKPFVKANRVLLAALGGAAAGVTLAGIMGTEKAQQTLHTVENAVSQFADKVQASVSKGFGSHEHNGNTPEKKRKQEPVNA